MIIIEDLFAILPEAILYIIYGFLFMQVYRFKILTSKSGGTENTLLTSLVIGFIIYKFMEAVPLTTGSTVYDMLLICIWSILGGYIFGCIYLSNGVQTFISDKLGIHKTLNTYIWDVIVSEDEPIMIRIRTSDDEYIEGFINLAEDNTDDPHLTIGNYIVYVKNGMNKELITSSSENELMMYDLRNAKYYEFIFDKKNTYKDLHKLNSLDKAKYLKEQEN